MAEGMRRIVVDGQPFRWRFDGVLVIIPGDRSAPQLYVDWGWRDWLESNAPKNKPLVITPRFVADAIKFATAQGWPATSGGRPLRLRFEVRQRDPDDYDASGNFVSRCDT